MPGCRAEGVAVYPWWVQRPPPGPLPPALAQVADHVLPGRSTVRLQQLVRAPDAARGGGAAWVNASQYAVLVTDLTEAEEERRGARPCPNPDHKLSETTSCEECPQPARPSSNPKANLSEASPT